jgi:hypothetical protein
VSHSYRFGNISGPVNTGNPVNHGGNQVVGEGSINISGGNRNNFGPDPAVLEALAGLRAQLDELRLTGSEREAAADDLARIEQAGADKPAAASAFESFLDRLKKAGALAQTGAEFTKAAGEIARWLGPLAAAALALL